MKKFFRFLDEHFWALLLFSFVCSVVFLLFASPYTTPLNKYYGYDSAVFMVLGRGTASGYLPYLDLYDNKGPMIYYIDALGWLLGGRNGIFFLQCVFMAFVFALTYRMARLYTGRLWSWVSVILLALVYCGTVGEGNMTEEWSLVFTILPLWLSLRFLNSGKTIGEHPLRYSFIYGLCLGVQLMFRVTNAFPLCGLILAFIILLIREKNFAALGKNALSVLLGCVVVIVPFVVYFLHIGAFDYFVYASLLHNFSYAADGAAEKTILDWLAMLARISAAPAVLVLSILFVRKKKLPSRDAVLICCVSIVGAFAMCFGHSYKHYFLLLAPAIAVTMAFLTKGIEVSMAGRRARSLCCLLLALFCFLPYAPQAAVHGGKSILYNFMGYLDDERAAYEELNELITEDRDSVWAYNDEAYVYMYLDVLPCFRYFTSQSWMANDSPFIQTEIEEMLENDPPVWIVSTADEETAALFTETYHYELVKEADCAPYPALYHLSR